MKQWIKFFGLVQLVLAGSAVLAVADVTVTNLVVAQRPGTKLVDITYDVSSTETNAVTVSLSVSNGAAAVSAPSVSGAVGAGVATGTGKTMVWNMGTDWNGNLSSNVFFAITADDGQTQSVSASCPVAKTGQTISYRAGDDGDLETGTAWPNPRFTDLSDGTVKDNLTGLEWVQAPHALPSNSGTMVWNSAIDFCNNLVYAGHSDWRLPSIKELESLVDYGRPEWPAGHPFAGVQDGDYWSGTSGAGTTGSWYVFMSNGSVDSSDNSSSYYVWPVRGGQ
ncbi:MAG: DUF1566 domain-containing protein [Kiritimatiellales bacterium]